MPLLDGGLAAVFGATFGAVMADGTLHKIEHADTYRAIKVDADPAGAAYAVLAVPA